VVVGIWVGTFLEDELLFLLANFKHLFFLILPEVIWKKATSPQVK
jgi:hypothetical protein